MPSFCRAPHGWSFAAAVAIATSATAVCAESPAPPANDAVQVEFFEKHIRPLLHERCAECHSSDGKKREGDLSLDSSAGLKSGGSRGVAFVAGKPDESRLIQAVRYADEDLQMPPSGKLPEEEIKLLEEWVARGAVVPEYGADVRPAAATIDFETARQFWSLRPLERHTAPVVASGGSVSSRIDCFLIARLEEHGLSLNPEADRRTFIRRATFDLIGLPPTPDEIVGFLADDAHGAYERLIDRLLASPHYGERWGRHWLDAARYTDETPSWLKSADRAWLYRDWVIRAFNEDLPYDRFVTLQLAADFLDETPAEDLAALGFLGLSPTYWKELRLAPDVIMTIVAEEWDERIDAVSRTFRGLTASCARCHDHKFDPITMQDYYALAGVFASTQLADRPLLKGEAAQTVIAARKRVDRLQAEFDKLQDKESEEARKLKSGIEQVRAATPHFDEPWAHLVEEASVQVLPDGPDATKIDTHPGEALDLPVFRRGNPANPGDVVPRRFLQVLSSPNRSPFERGSGRLELAEAILNDARPLAARVIVNRAWREHFGQGIVRTPSDFGAQGERPTHPELLDDLAARFIENGWSLKWLHREIMLSAAYRQSSAPGDEAFAVDPENRLLWRMNRRRLDIEAWRDAMLVAAGNLDPALGGPARELADAANDRRTVYGKVGRDEMNDMLRLYDFPEPSAHSPGRDLTTTPLQQLFVLNSPFVGRQAAALAKHLCGESPDGSDNQRIDRVYELLFGRLPTESERSVGLIFLSASADNGSAVDRWQPYVQALLGLNECLFVD